MGPWPVLLLAALVPAAALGAGPHRLQYELTETQDATLYSQFVAKEHLDDQLILCYDGGNSRPETPGLLARVILGAEPGDTVTSGFAEDRRGLWSKLADIREKQSQSGGSRSLQEVRGCEIHDDNTTRAFRRFYYNGEPFLFYNEATHEWEAPQSSVLPLAVEVKNSWDTDRIGSQNSWALVRGDVCGKLQRYRQTWKAFTKRTAVNATCSQASEGVVNVTCWASGFSPWNISLVWLQDDEPLSPDAQLPGGVPCDENGTYRAWVALRLPKGEEQRVTCSVEHYWNCTVTCGNVQVHQRPWPAMSWGITVAATFTVLVAAVLLYNFRLRKTSAGERPGPFSGEDLSQVVRTDLHSAGAQGSQRLLSAPESRDSTGGA
ncbi:MHC class I polypeptide-related sequence B-like [Talpa occidentalis]|uniref:MHC class I polypeptide-related sequence B-like n=1 Tax=Talpa occidentalis TaxID=50954 RepID=UPI0018902DA7|nr:MHC class I polypeptide-related sequence B-like [Talpa occidentalis]